MTSLAIGRHGWFQPIDFIVVGLLYSCAARGLRCSSSQRVGPGAVPVLVAGVGLGLIGSGMFATDPVGDFPPNASGVQRSDDASSGTTLPTLAGRPHNLFAIPIFAGIPLAGLASATTAMRLRDYRWAGYSLVSSVPMVGTFALFESAYRDGSPHAGQGGKFQRISIAAGFGWIAALSLSPVLP